MSDYILEAHQVSKSFGATRALDAVSFAVRQGEVHALLGENGAGKSTLMKIISGSVRLDHGQLCISGQPIRIEDPHHATALGITIVHQHSAVIPSLTMAENIFLGRIPLGPLGLVNWRRLFRDSQALLARLGFDLDVRRKVDEFGAAGRQLTEIARALSIDARIIIMDEPSASLGPLELRKLFQVIAVLKTAGRTILYISHRLPEIFEIADRVTVLKDGRVVGTYAMGPEVDRKFLISRMVGREWSEQFPARQVRLGNELLRVNNFSRRGSFDGVSFSLCAGEIVGLAGLVGSGRTELCRAIFGAERHDAGSLVVRGRPSAISSPAAALANGIAYLSEDRHREGLVLCLPIAANLSLPILHQLTRYGLLQHKLEATLTERLIRQLGVRARGPGQIVATLSGGNQQKVSLGKWLATRAQIFLLDEPTVGIDVGAKRDTYELILSLADHGAAVLMVSSDIPEILSMSDRILVMKWGRIAGELSRAQASEEAVMQYAA